MANDIRFKEKDVEELEEKFTKIEIDKSTRNLINQSAKFLIRFIPISEMAMKGNIWRTIKQWQIDNKKIIGDITALPLDEQNEITKDLFARGKELMKRMLVNPEEQKELLDKAYDEAYKFYLELAKKMGL